MNTAQMIRDTLTMYDILSRYGYEWGRSGFMRCPFHEEKTASFKVYADGKRFKCFGCGEGGTVIDFVMKLFGIGFRQAIVRIDVDFGLNLTGQKADSRALLKLQAEKRRKEAALSQYRREYRENCETYRYCWTLLQNTPRPEEAELLADEVAQGLAKAKAELEYLEYWFEENPWR